MSTNPYDLRITVIDDADPNVIVLEINMLEGLRVAADWLNFYLTSPDMAITGPESGHSYTCRVYEYGSGVPVDEATTTV